MNYSPSLLLDVVELAQNADGIWYAAEQEDFSYPNEGNDQCFEIEDKSFWFQYCNACVIELVKKFPPRGNGPISDVGGGNGFVAKGLMDVGWDVVLIEPGPAGARNAKKRGLQHVVCATTQAAGFRPGRMPAIGVFDVVEHIQDDLAFLRHLHAVLEPGGMLYLTVPANPYAWSNEDIYAGHFRRYTPETLSKVLKDAGLEIQFMTGIFAWLLVPVFLRRAFPYRLRAAKGREGSCRAMSADHSPPAVIAPLAKAANRSQLKRPSRRRSFSFGSSLMCAAHRN